MERGKSIVRAVQAEQSLTPYEAAVIGASPFGKASDASKDKIFSAALKSVGSAKICGGQFEGLTFDEALAIRTFAFCMDHPDPANVKAMLTIRGEIKDSDVSVTLSAVDRDLQSRALGEGKDAVACR
ncbi:MAG: hypothetical protein LKG11_00750 [Bacilli bacterium]|nr:hypothetical protein [Bacilli bacterium]